MHPSEAIHCEKSEKLKGIKIVMGITGSIAATECIKLIRELIRHGASVLPVMSEWAQRIIHPNALEFASGRKPITEIDGSVQYVDMCGDMGEADMMLIAPATSNTISKIANGIADTPVSMFAITCLGSGKHLMIAPAMHISLYDHHILKENIRKLEKVGTVFVDPRIGEHKAKMADIEHIVSSVIRELGPRDMDKKRIVVIAGSTQEPVDDIRVLTNKSSGRTGIELALDAYERGAEVDLWLGATSCKPPTFVKLRRFSTSSDLLAMIKGMKCDVCAVPAAICDYIPKKSKGKIPSSRKSLSLDLERAPKIIEEIKRSRKKTKVVAFKLESNLSRNELVKRAMKRLREAKVDFIVANDVMNVRPDSNEVVIIDKNGGTLGVKGTKAQIAHEIWSAVLNGI